MPSLHEFQSAMTAYLRSPPGPDVPVHLKSMLAPAADGAERRLAVYKNNVYARLVDVLRGTFPVVECLVGEDFFRYAAVQYAASVPPPSPTLLGYGDGFAEFLHDFTPAQSVPYLPDVARLEYLYLQAYHAPDAEPIAETVGIDAAEGLTLHPSAYLLTSEYQVSRIWDMNRRKAVPDTILPAEREYLLIMRPQRTVEVRRVSLGAFAALMAFDEGSTLSDAQREAEWAEPAIDFRTLLMAMVASGAFIDIRKKGKPR